MASSTGHVRGIRTLSPLDCVRGERSFRVCGLPSNSRPFTLPWHVANHTLMGIAIIFSVGANGGDLTLSLYGVSPTNKV